MQWQHPTKQPRLFLVMLTMTSRKTPFLRGQLKNQRLNFFVVLLLLIYLQSVAKYGILSGSELKNKINFDAFAICNYRICKIFFMKCCRSEKKCCGSQTFIRMVGIETDHQLFFVIPPHNASTILPNGNSGAKRAKNFPGYFTP